MIMTTIRRFSVPVLILSCFGLFACSKAKESDQEVKLNQTQQQAKDAIQDYGKRRIDEARKAQALSLDRDKVIDGAVENSDKK